ncbi:hypothetical protein PHMEG_00011034 [Phytophthora megakarya]|uniref:Uncharacterized protein n=1 Tax=Phytophthora megakarya TaxID=4795 RepID=A0A225WCI2_9STRA|nr:hypothetical protein PHMEG_00011034 [Phytophthora megakarya]
MAGLGPRVVQVLEFAHARAPELQALHELSQHDAVSSASDVKLETQKNQRRRRANAFKRHNMPQRLRSTPKTNITSVRCRKHVRRPHKMLEERSVADSERPRWLSSHVWHAKRMKMSAQHGYMLALHRADKSVSAAMQAVREKSVLHDSSYYGVIELFGLPQVILEALQLVSDPNGSDFHGLKFLAGTEEGSSMLYHEGQFPQGAIAPVTFMWRPLQKDYENGEFQLHENWQNTKRELWLWVHPAAYMEAATAISMACQEVVREDEDALEMNDRRGTLSRLKLRGRLADELMELLASGGDDDQPIPEEFGVSDHDDGFSKKETIAQCRGDNRLNLIRALRKTSKKTEVGEKKDAIYSVALKDPRLARCRDGKLCHSSARPVAEFSLLKEPPASVVSEVGVSEIASPLSGLSLSSLGKDAEEPESKVILKEMQALLAWTTSGSEDCDSSAYPRIMADGARAKLDTEDDCGMEINTSPSSLLWSLSKRAASPILSESNFIKRDHTLNEEIYRQRKDGVLDNGIDGVHVKVPLLHLMAIRKREPYPHTSGWDIICLPSSVPSLLKVLVFGGALVVGLEENAALSTVLHQPSFPRDYPDTQAGQVYWKARASTLESEQAKKPKAKRFNYEKHGVKSPFQPQWELLFDTQNRERDEQECTQTPCVLRGEKYMEPFCFYKAKRTTTDKDETLTTSESIVSVPIPTLVRIVIIIPRRGNIDVNAMLFAPSTEDVEQFRNDKSWKGYDLNMKSKASKTDKRSLIGYVTSSIYDRPKGAFRVTGFIACEPLQQLFLSNQSHGYGKQGHYALAMVRSSQGRMVRPVLVQAEI